MWWSTKNPSARCTPCWCLQPMDPASSSTVNAGQRKTLRPPGTVRATPVPSATRTWPRHQSRPCCCYGVPPYRHPPGRIRPADRSRYGTTINGVKHQGGSVPLSDGDRAQLAPKAFLTWVVGRAGGVTSTCCAEKAWDGDKARGTPHLLPQQQARCRGRRRAVPSGQECAGGGCCARHAETGNVL